MAEKNAGDIIKLIKDEKVEYVDIRFCDLPGVVQHFSIPASAFDESVFEDGLAFDGSSVRGFQSIHESDMKLLPDVATAYIDPFRVEKTLIMNFSIVDPFTDEPYSRDPRNVAANAEAYLKSTDTAMTLPRQLPQCMAEYSPLGNSVVIVTSRGFSPDYTANNNGETQSGSVIWLQSIVSLQS